MEVSSILLGLIGVAKYVLGLSSAEFLPCRVGRVRAAWLIVGVWVCLSVDGALSLVERNDQTEDFLARWNGSAENKASSGIVSSTTARSSPESH